MSNKIVPVAVWANQDELHMAYLNAKTQNRMLGIELACANEHLNAIYEQRENKKRVYKAALKLLGWLGFGLAWGVLAMACWYFAPKWTCIAPAVLMGLAWWKAGGEV